MLEFGDKVVGKVMIPMDITEDDVCNIIVGSIEGGSNYWMGLDDSLPEWNDIPKDEPLATWATKLILEDKSIKLYDIERTEDDSNWILTLKKLLNGIKLNAINRPFASDKEKWDAGDNDCIIQYALFKEVVFG